MSAQPSSPVPRRKQTAIPFVDAPSLVGFALPWQVKPGREARAVVIKGTFDLVPGEPLRLRDEPDLPSGDLHAGDEPTRSLRYASDFAFFKPRADVTLTGHAHPAGGSSPAGRVLFRFGRRSNGFERTIAVFGERRWQGVLRLVPTDPRPFSKMPLVYERAFGGPRVEANPVGLGRDGDLLPNLEDPSNLVGAPSDAPAPACFGAIPMLWRARWSKLGTFGAAWLETRWPYFPDDFDWGFFQAAPPQQQLAYLDGDEPFEIVGAHPEHPVIAGSLPRLRVRCFSQTTTEAGGAFAEVVLRLDTVSFDVDDLKANVLWRGLIEVRDDEASEIAELFVLAEPLAGSPATLDDARARYLAARAARERRGDDESAPPPAAPAPPAAPRERLPPHLDPIRQSVLAHLAAGASLAGLELVGADLSDLDFSGRSLVRTNLAEARLCRCRFTGADLTEASLAGADLTDASLVGAQLERADLTAGNLEGADLSGARLDEADCSGARGARVSFREARGRGVSFVEGAWPGACFQGAQLEAADFTRAELDDAVFDGASLEAIRLYDTRGSRVSFRQANLDRARADGACLLRSSFQGASARSSVWDGATLDESNFLGAKLVGAGFVKASCRRAIFSGADLSGGRFSRAVLAGAAFLKANLMEASFEAADLTGADLRGANLHGAETWKATLAGAKLDLAILTRTKLATRT